MKNNQKYVMNYLNIKKKYIMKSKNWNLYLLK